MTSWTDIVPTILDWSGVKKPDALPGRSLLQILEQKNPPGWDLVFGSHQFHEVTMYYPMRMVRTRTHKLILNLAHPLEYPSASDLWASPSWQGVLKRGDRLMGRRTVDGYLHRQREELYDLVADPDELTNLASDARALEILNALREKLRDWQKATNDPWIVKYTHE
jgi:N-sulfoglucosamine sulfohydrolase